MRCYACAKTLLGGADPAYRWHWEGTGLRELLCPACCAEWRRWAWELNADLPYRVYSLHGLKDVNDAADG